ncbi:MAG: Y-family DNA polymerase [Alkalilacustris sp.]
MPHRRFLSLWFPRLAAERVLRRLAPPEPVPLAVVAEEARVQRLAAVTAEAEAAGLWRGQPLRDAQAVCPGLVTRAADPGAEAAFLGALRRWLGRVSPWVAEAGPDGLVADLTGCAHLFGGEAALVARLEREAGELGLTLRAGLADTVGAAWALARYGDRGDRGGHDRGGGGASGAPVPAGGNAIAAEARATRSRAAPRRVAPAATGGLVRIAPPGETRTALEGLPVAALRLSEGVAEALAQVGLRRVGDLWGLPRASLARRFGRDLVRRLDQALGAEPEPVAPAGPPLHFAVRLSLPEPIGLRADLEAALDRMLPRLCARLAERGRGARRLRLQAQRCDGGVAVVEVGLARPTQEAARMRPLLEMKLDGIDAGFGIDLLRLEAVVTEPVAPRQHPGPLGGSPGGPSGAPATAPAADRALDDLIGRLGARLGMEAVTRLHPADSHIPEKAETRLAAAWSEPFVGPWPAGPAAARPLRLMVRPELVQAPGTPALPDRFRWRRRAFDTLHATGPERIAPEWWLDDPAWRSGVRDYWRVQTRQGPRLWLFHAHGGAVSGGWFCHGVFA